VAAREGSFALGLFAFFVGLLLALAAVVTSQEFRTDHRNPEYVLWKAGIGKFEPRFLANLTKDPYGAKLVKGLTLSQLRDRFGWIREDRDARQAWLGASNLAVSLENGRVTRLSVERG
jgi:hypothetical protein